MNKYLDAIKKVEMPKSDEVKSNLVIVLVGMIALTAFFIMTDGAISFVLDNLYN